MKVRGSSYRVVAVSNPLGRFPARAYPVFQLSNEVGVSGRLYRQILSDDGKIQDFLRLNSGGEDRLIAVNDGVRASFVGQLALYVYAHSDQHISIIRGLEEFRQYFSDIFTESRYRELEDYPLSAVELARFVGDEMYEEKFAEIATMALAKRSLQVAEGWLIYSALSVSARQAGLKLLAKIKKDADLEEEVEDIRTIQLSDKTFLQGDFIRSLQDGNVQIRIDNKVFKGRPIRHSK